jgi:ribonucleoside-diphosphate reductase alpha chain
MIKFEDVANVSTKEYFNDNQFSIDAFDKKYSQNVNGKKESYPQALKRVCDYIASAEKTEEERKYWAERWFDEIYNDWWHPAGSIMQGANSNRGVSLSNCTTISLGNINKNVEWDSLEGIIKNTAYTVAKTAAHRQGLGVDFSAIRPKQFVVNNSSNESQGALHWMKLIDSIGNYIGQKGRIPAMLFSLSVNHPDIEDFVKAKSDYTSIQNANISVQTNDAFYKAVEDDADWELTFTVPGVQKGQKVYIDVHSSDMSTLQDEQGYYYIAKRDRKEEKISRTVKARELLQKIAKNMATYAEPGIQQMDMARKWSNSDYVYNPDDIYDSRIQSSNACSEQYLSRDSLCVLASINAAKFDADPEVYKPELKKIGYSVNRFLDNVNEMELRGQTYATPHQKLAIEKLRRTGAGITNIAGWLFKQNLEYGSALANSGMFEFNKMYNYYLYESSIELGKEKGSFGLFVREKYEQSPFIQEMMKLGLKFEAMRNVTCSSIAPNGTLSLMMRDFVMSYGVEPGFGIYFWKRSRMSGSYQYYFCVPHVVRQVFAEHGYPIPMESDTLLDTWDGALGKPIAKFIDENKDKIGIKFKNSTEIKALDKLDLMSKLMQYVDSSISVTYSLPHDATWEDTYNLIIEANKRGVKSIAAFPDKKMYGIVSFMPFKELAVSLKTDNIAIHPTNFNEEELKELNIIGDEVKNNTYSPKRLKELDADIHIVTASGKKYIMVVGMQRDRPYELFGGLIKDGLVFKQAQKKGKIVKIKKGMYSLEIGEEIVIENFGEYFTAIEQSFFRLVSLHLRKGTPIKEIAEQLSEASDDMVSLTAAASRVLRKYIKNGEEVVGMKCPSCGKGNLYYNGGCASCSCGWEKCS